jgi:zinc transporter 1/2/3
MKLTQGLMSAISAGTLIYASCVEMLAGDFVMTGNSSDAEDVGGVSAKVIALCSVGLGVLGMGMVG